ncbi:unnamed protein product [Medioppia subpectinata]|uniref:Uncharacterized protein n=1 Tax=Medioppia subpectinata TaxID=1979941 RepID=A0A7R9L0N1_9ACAR|nr:unnamed protein product [Medioppia subpectinata]CAG2112139.1 unnamed protein product [Medioppia subpectinata]
MRILRRAETNESPKTRNEVIDDKRESIKYVVNVLNRLDKGLENLDKADSNRCLSGIPGGDCSSDLGDWANIPSRNPGKRSVRQTQSANNIHVFKRKKCITGIPGADCDVDVGPVVTEIHRNPGKRSVRVEIMAAKRGVDCSPIGGLPGADCDWNEMGEEAKAQKLMKSSIRNPGRKRRSLH